MTLENIENDRVFRLNRNEVKLLEQTLVEKLRALSESGKDNGSVFGLYNLLLRLRTPRSGRPKIIAPSWDDVRALLATIDSTREKSPLLSTQSSLGNIPQMRVYSPLSGGYDSLKPETAAIIQAVKSGVGEPCLSDPVEVIVDSFALAFQRSREPNYGQITGLIELVASTINGENVALKSAMLAAGYLSFLQRCGLPGVDGVMVGLEGLVMDHLEVFV